MNLVPLHLAEAVAYVKANHRHHGPPVGHKFSLGAEKDGVLVGVVCVGRPVARMLDNGSTLEVTRLTTDGTKNACSFLYAAAWRATRALGYHRLITYTLASESGGSLRASGWKLIGERGGGEWGRPSRPRAITAPTETKLLWEAV